MQNIYEQKIQSLELFLNDFKSVSSLVDKTKKDIFKKYFEKLETTIWEIKKNQNGKITVSIVSNYSCWKTTIVRNLTGNKELKVWVAPETDKIQEILWWENAILADTPWFNSGIIEHDTITKNYIFKSDIVIYVITMWELFLDNGVMFKEICETLWNNKKDNIILLVNKLSWKWEKNIPWTTETINKVLYPYNSNDFSLYFIDALDYEKWNDNNIELLIQRSKFHDFEKVLNEKISKTDKINSLNNSIRWIQKILADFLMEYNTEEEVFKKVIFNNKKILWDLETIKQEKENNFRNILSQEIRNLKQEICFKIDEEIQDINQEALEHLQIFIKNSIHNQINITFSSKVNELLEDMWNDFEQTLENFQNEFYLEAIPYDQNKNTSSLVTKEKMLSFASIFKNKESVLNIGRSIRYTFGKEAWKSAYKIVWPLSKIAPFIWIALNICEEYGEYQKQKQLEKFKYDVKQYARNILDEEKNKVYELFSQELLWWLDSFSYTQIKNTLKEYEKSLYQSNKVSWEIEGFINGLNDSIVFSQKSLY